MSLCASALMLGLVPSIRLTPRAAQPVMRLEDSPVIIVPGFGNADVDYSRPLGQPEEVGFEAVLSRRGFSDVCTLPVERFEWGRVILGLIGAIIWRPWATPEGPAYAWFIARLRNAVDDAHTRSGGKKVLLCCHSAGGWLARAALADGAWSDGRRASDVVSGLVTLGTPQFPPEEGTVTDMTQGVIKFVDDTYPGAFLASEGIGYVTVGGDTIVGDDSKGKPGDDATDADKVYALRGEGSASRAAYTSYLMTCGRGDVSGDGVVPIDWTLLDGAKQLRLPGVLHSINEAGTTLPTDRWYGSEKIVDMWLPAVREATGESGGIGGALEAAGQQFMSLLSRELGAPNDFNKP